MGHARVAVGREHEVRRASVEHHSKFRHDQLARVRRVTQIALRRRTQQLRLVLTQGPIGDE